jgi:hypothetical protein
MTRRRVSWLSFMFMIISVNAVNETFLMKFCNTLRHLNRDWLTPEAAVLSPILTALDPG